VNDRISVGQAGLNGRPHALYRFFDRSDVLLYVGITIDIGARFKKHQSDKPWWSEVEHIGIERHGTRREALDAESRAILTEEPLYNVAQNQFAAAPGDARAELARELLGEYLGVELGGEEYTDWLSASEMAARASDYRLDQPDVEVLKSVVLDRDAHRELFEDAAMTIFEALGDDVMGASLRRFSRLSPGSSSSTILEVRRDPARLNALCSVVAQVLSHPKLSAIEPEEE
jgi:hypothetical protein